MYRTSQPPSSNTLRCFRRSKSPGNEVDDLQPHVTQSNTETWKPVSLRTSSLIGFIILFILLSLGLVLLYVLAKETKGFNLVLDNHYAWVYGPTGVLILIISLWRQVDYNCKILTPWDQLAVGNKDAKSTIFLDHVSSFQLVTLYQAIANGHMAVTITTLGFFVLKLVAIASTGLLIVQTIPVAVPDHSLLLTTEFNYTRASYVDVGHNLTSALFRSYGYLLMDMPFVDGVTANSTYQSVSLSSSTDILNTTYSTQVKAFSPIVECQRVDVTLYLLDDQIMGGLLAWNFSITDPCNITQELGWSCKPGAFDCPSSEYQLYTVPTDCGIPGESWLFLGYGQFLHSQIANDSKPESDAFTNYTNPSVMPQGWSLTPGNDSSWMCKIDYEIHEVEVLYDPSRNSSVVQVGAPTQIMTSGIPGFSPSNLTEELYWGLRSNRFDNTGVIYLSNSTSRESSDPLIGIMKQMVHGTEDTFTENPDSMGPVAETVLRQVASQIVAQVAMQPANISTSGHVFASEPRLHVNVTVLSFMAASLFVMASISAGLVWLRPFHADIPARPDTLKHMASLLTSSDGFRTLLNSIDSLSEKAALKESQHLHYSTKLCAKDLTCLQTTPLTANVSVNSSQPSQRDSDLHWWLPLTLEKSVITLSIIVPMLSVGVLEVLQRLSDRNDGFVTLHPKTSQLLESAYTRFLPALVMLLVATLATSLDFNAAVLAPFDSLRRDHTNSLQVISTSVLGKLPPLALLRAVKQRQWSSASAAIAAFISSLLTITVSGLYTVDPVPTFISIDLVPQDLIQLQWDNSALDDGGAAVVLSLIESANLTQPAFTYGELVFPNFSLPSNLSLASGVRSGLIEIYTPAFRGNLDCHDYNLQSNWSLLNISRVNNWGFGHSSSVPLPSNCRLGGPYGNQTTIDFRTDWTISPAGNDGQFYVAKLQDLHVGPYPSYNTDTDELDNFDDNPPGCPSLALSWGWADTSRNISSGVSVMVCNQQLQQVSARLILTYPDLTIQAAYPPEVNESEVLVLNSGPNNATAFPFRIENAMSMTFSLFNQSGTSPEELSAKRMIYDGFFTGVIFGKNQLGSNFQVFDNHKIDMFMSGINSFYRRYMAQVMNAKMRLPKATGPKEDNRMSATLMNDSGALRMVQHNQSKVILQSMLSAMTFFALLSLYFGKFHKIVPWNPCSIAGTAILFSGSTMYEQIRSGSSPTVDNDADQSSDTVTEIEDIDEGTPLIGCDVDANRDVNSDSKRETTDDKVASMWGSFSSPSRVMRAQKRELERNQDVGVDLRTARLRLGWWRDGVFFGDSGPTKREREEDRMSGRRSWRYGIDCLSSRHDDAWEGRY